MVFFGSYIPEEPNGKVVHEVCRATTPVFQTSEKMCKAYSLILASFS